MNRVSASWVFKFGAIVLALAAFAGASATQQNWRPWRGTGSESKGLAGQGTKSGARLLELDHVDEMAQEKGREEPIPLPAPSPTLSAEEIALEQTSQGPGSAVPMLDSFDGLGAGFQGPQGTAEFRNPSDNSLAVGPNHIVQTVNSRVAIYSKKGRGYDKTGTVLSDLWQPRRFGQDSAVYAKRATTATRWFAMTNLRSDG